MLFLHAWMAHAYCLGNTKPCPALPGQVVVATWHTLNYASIIRNKLIVIKIAFASPLASEFVIFEHYACLSASDLRKINAFSNTRAEFYLVLVREHC